MARAKTKIIAKITPTQSSTKNATIESIRKFNSLSSQIKLGESYVSLILGAIVVLGLSVVFFLFIRGSNLSSGVTPIDQSNLPESVNQIPTTKSHILQEGE